MDKQLTAAQAAYVAGALDGEGCITIRREAPRVAAGRVSPQFQFIVKLTNTHKPWIDMLHEWLGGNVHQINGLGARNRKVCWDLRLRASEVQAVLPQLMPYLVIKRRQAELMTRYFDLAHQRRLANRPGVAGNPDLIVAQESLYQEFKALNRRGVTASVNLTGRKPVTVVCSIDGCDRKHYGRGYCLTHYHKFVARGGPKAYEKKCIVCGKPFTARRSDAECCSVICSNRNQYLKNPGKRKAQVAAWRQRNKHQSPS